MFKKKLVSGADVINSLPYCIKRRILRIRISDSSPVSFGYEISADDDLEALATIIREASILYLRNNHYPDEFLMGFNRNGHNIVITVRYARNKGDLHYLRNTAEPNEFNNIK